MRAWFIFVSLLIALTANAIDPLPFENYQQEKRFQKLVAELRCLQCQNQNLADSDAALARDMRNQVFEMMQAGKSDPQIKQYMIDRFGEFVVYTPSFNARNAWLWILPFAVLGMGVGFVFWHFQRRPKRDKQTSEANTSRYNSEDW
jgi:cytochrome c-type biogenesis protein CcmH